MKKPIFATLGIVVCSLAVLNDLSHAQPGLSPVAPAQTGTTTTIAPTAGAAALGQGAAIDTSSGGGAGSVSATTTPGTNNGTATNGFTGSTNPAIGDGIGNSTGIGTTTGPSPTFGPGNSTGPAITGGAGASNGAGNTVGPATNFGPGNSVGPGNSLGPSSNLSPGNSSGMSASSLQLRGTVMSSGPTVQSMGSLAANPNMQVVRNAAGDFFIMSPNGQLQAVAPGTNVQGLLASSLSDGFTPIQRARMFNGVASPYVATPMTLIHTTNDGNVPAAVASRDVFTNGYPTSVSGQIIAEYPTRKVETFARVYPRSSAKVVAHKRMQRKHSGVYLK
jgi:hypothetical protein